MEGVVGVQLVEQVRPPGSKRDALVIVEIAMVGSGASTVFAGGRLTNFVLVWTLAWRMRSETSWSWVGQ